MVFDNLAKLNRSSRNAFSAALILIAAIAMYNRIVAPQAACLLAAQQHKSVVDNITKQNKIISSTVNIEKKKLQELREQFVQLQRTLFTPEEAKEFFSDLQAISEQAGCAVHSLNLITGEQSSKDQQSEDSSGIVAKSVLFSIVGRYENIIGFVERLQKRTQKVWIDSLKMEISDYDSVQPKCDMTITIYTVHAQEGTADV